MKHMERVKKMVKWAGKNGWFEKDALSYFSVNFKRKETEYLTWEQLCWICDKSVLASDLHICPRIYWDLIKALLKSGSS
ncbi:hypothetical protein MMC2321_01556 [Chitinophaga sp. MM2321]